MAAFLGLTGTGKFTADERPKNWREMILLLFPNGEAPLTALLSKLRSQGTDDAEYNWWEKRLPVQRLVVSGAQTNVDTAIEFVAGAKDAVAGTTLRNERTGEIVKVTVDPTTDTALTVQRGYGTVAGAAMNDQDVMTVIGNAHPEGSSIPTAKTYAPTKQFNYTQIFRMPLSMTRTARKTRLRWDNTGPYRESKREALSLHSIEMEKAFIFGQKLEVTGANGQPERQTGGILSFLTSNIGGAFAVNGGLSEAVLDTLCEQIFRYGETEKLVLCGSTFARAITTLAKTNGVINLVPTDQTYGLKVVEYVSAFGTMMIKMHPLFNQHPDWRKNALVLDVDNLVYRYIDDTMFVRNRQNPGDDLSKDEFLTECGLEVHMEETHSYITGVTGAA